MLFLLTDSTILCRHILVAPPYAQSSNKTLDSMALNELLQSKLRKKYQPSSMVEMKFKGKDLTFKTDDEGNAVTLFIGKIQPDGKIKGERYKRTLIRLPGGEIVKDHWDLKGKA